MSEPGPAVSVIVTAYNEARIIERNLRELLAAVPLDASGRPTWQIVVVDDGSVDDTTKILFRLREEGLDFEVAIHDRNRGRGQAIRSGFERARGRYIVCLDADLSYGSEHVEKLTAPLVTGEADVTLASAYHPDGRVENVSFLRLLVSRIGNRILSWGLHRRFYTVTCMVRGFRREVVESLFLRGTGKDLHLEILQKALILGYRVKEVPATLRWRERDRRGARGFSFLLGTGETFASHLLYSYMLRPSLVARLPVALLSVVVVTGLCLLGFHFVRFLTVLEPSGGLGIQVYHALRQTLVTNQVTVLATALSLIFVIQIVTLLLLGQTISRHFAELYALLAALRRETRHPRDAEPR